MKSLVIWFKKLFGIELTAEERLYSHEGPVLVATPSEPAKPIIVVPINPPSATPPTPRPTINAKGLELVKYYEGCQLRAYRDSVGVCTIGWGRIKYDDGSSVKMGDTCDQAMADKWLMEDLEKEGAHYLRAWLQVPLNDDQWDALVSFTYNRGAGRLKGGVLPFINHSQFNNAMRGLMSFDWAGHQGNHLLGLQRRRLSEKALFWSQDWKQFTSWKP